MGFNRLSGLFIFILECIIFFIVMNRTYFIAIAGNSKKTLSYNGGQKETIGAIYYERLLKNGKYQIALQEIVIVKTLYLN